MPNGYSIELGCRMKISSKPTQKAKRKEKRIRKNTSIGQYRMAFLVIQREGLEMPFKSISDHCFWS